MRKRTKSLTGSGLELAPRRKGKKLALMFFAMILSAVGGTERIVRIATLVAGHACPA